MPSRKISSTSTVCAAAPLMRAAVRTVARLPRARCESPRSSSPARARSSSTAGGTTAPGSNAAYQSITARLAWCSTWGAMGRLRFSPANRAKRSPTYTYSTSAPYLTLLRFDPRLFHQLGPLRPILAYEARELLGCVARGFGSEGEHFLARVAHREHAIHVGGGPCHTCFRRCRRREQAEPAYRFVSRESRFGDGWKIRQGLRAPGPGDGERL